MNGLTKNVECSTQAKEFSTNDAHLKKYEMNTSRERIIRLLIYFIIVFIATFLYSYFKKN